MKEVDQFVTIIHILAGVISLIAFWIPVFSKKGGKLHIRAGKIYIYTMWIVVITAIVMCLYNALMKEFVSAAFLGFLSVLTGRGLWYGIAILRNRKYTPDGIFILKRVMDGVLVFGGAGLIIWSLILGLQGMSVLLLIFGILGMTALPEVVRSIATSRAKSHRIVDHLDGMIGSGIAAYTAFFAFGGRTFFMDIFSGPLMVIPWVLPSIIGGYFIYRLKKQRMATA